MLNGVEIKTIDRGLFHGQRFLLVQPPLCQLGGVARGIVLHENSYIILSRKGENLVFQNI